MVHGQEQILRIYSYTSSVVLREAHQWVSLEVEEQHGLVLVSCISRATLQRSETSSPV